MMGAKPEEIYRPVIDLDLEGDVAIVTGATGGLGVPICIALAECGANIGAIARDEKNLEKLSYEIRKRDRKYKSVAADVRNIKEIESAFESICSDLGPVDILVNGAGVTTGKNILEITEEDVDLEIDTNLKGPLYCSKVALKYMKEKGSGRIINIGSIRAETSGTDILYSLTKAGVIGLTKGAIVELADYGVTINCISPTHIDAGIFGRKPAEEKERYLKDIPLGRFGRPEEVAYWVCCFASRNANYVTGQNLPVDGGYLCRR